MEELGTLFIILSSLLVVTLSQRIAPGVPPQQYQQQPPPPPNQQYQQIPQQHQQQYQVPVQQQPQVPIQQQQQQPPYQQVPIQHQAPIHGAPQAHNPHVQQQQILHSSNIAHEKQHIQEHMDVPIDTSKMSEQELQFHYFKMHDADNNNKLDGCELIKSLIHWHAESESNDKTETRAQTDDELEAMIDPILKEMDNNNDGYVDYAEFKKAEG